MTMRLDIVTNDAGDLVRREHARELGAGVVVAIYRLAKLAQMHDLGNQAFVRQLEQAHQAIGEYCLRSGSDVSALFAHKATFVAGQLLKGSRGVYEAAAELGALLDRLGGAELHVSRDTTREDLFAFAEAISVFHRSGNASQVRLPPRIHLRKVADAARLRGIELEDLTADQRIVRAYASAVVIMRRFFEDLAASRYVLPRRIKRIAQSLVDLSDASTASFLGVTEVRNANYDEAGRAVNTAILAVSIAREAIQDRPSLAQIAMAAMMHDVARPRALALAGAGGAPMPGMAGPTTLSEDQEDRLAAGAAAVLTALGRVNEPSIVRTVLAFEAQWLRRKTWLGPVYWGARAPAIHSSIIAIARRYNDLLTPEPGLEPPTTDHAVATLAAELADAQDRTVLRMLVSALGLLPTGTVVQLSTGEVAEVVRGARGLGDKPRVKVLSDASGASFGSPIEIELAHDPTRTIHRVLSVEGWQKGLVQELEAAGPGPGPDSDEQIAVETDEDAPQGVRPRLGSSDSLSSVGSSPSSVAAAMGRDMGEPHGYPSAPPVLHGAQDDRGNDRTVFQPNGPGGVPARAQAGDAPRSPAARGSLATSPVPHVLVYMLDHALTGSIVFEGTDLDGGQDDTLYFVEGVPAKVRLHEPIMPLGELLAEHGILARDAIEPAVEGARRLGILLGEHLVGHEIVTRESLAWGLEVQLLQRIAHIANLPSDIAYAYYRDVDLLDGWGGDVLVSHPVSPILAAVRDHADRARIRATVRRIGGHTLALHPSTDLSKLAALDEERVVIESLRGGGMSLAQLVDAKLADEEVLYSLVYTLAVTRQFAFPGQKKGPMAVKSEAAPPPSSRSPASVRGAPSRSEPARGAPPPSRPRPSSAKLSAVTPADKPARAPGPAMRPSSGALPRASVPQIRPIAKKATGSAQQERDVSDDAKTIARPAPSVRELLAKRAAGGPRPAAAAPAPRRQPPPEPAERSEIDEAEAALEAMASFRLAETALQRNDAAAAEEHAMKAIAGDPTCGDYIALLAWIRALGAAPQPIEEAIRTMSKVLIEDPSNERALFYRGKLLVRTNRLPEALHDFSELLSSNPNHREAQLEVRQLKAKLPAS